MHSLFSTFFGNPPERFHSRQIILEVIKTPTSPCLFPASNKHLPPSSPFLSPHADPLPPAIPMPPIVASVVAAIKSHIPRIKIARIGVARRVVPARIGRISARHSPWTAAFESPTLIIFLRHRQKRLLRLPRLNPHRIHQPEAQLRFRLQNRGPSPRQQHRRNSRRCASSRSNRCAPAPVRRRSDRRAQSRRRRNRPSILTVRSPAGTLPQLRQNRQLPPIHYRQIRKLHSQLRNSRNSSGFLRGLHHASHHLPAPRHHPPIHHKWLLQLRRELVPDPVPIAR